MPALFVMAVQNYDKFEGRRTFGKGGKEMVSLDKEFQFNVISVGEIVVQKGSRLAQYLPEGSGLKVI